MKEKKFGIQGVMFSHGVAPPPCLKVKIETQFCHHCGGWCVIDMIPCPVCLGKGSVSVALPMVEEISLAE